LPGATQKYIYFYVHSQPLGIAAVSPAHNFNLATPTRFESANGHPKWARFFKRLWCVISQW